MAIVNENGKGTETPKPKLTTIDDSLVELIRFVEVYTDDEDISEADRKGIDKARAQISALIEEIIGEDEPYVSTNRSFSTDVVDNVGIGVRNQLRAEQRKAAKERGLI